MTGELERLLLMDGQDYDPGLPEIYRIAVRGVIELDGSYLFVEDSTGVLKLPGGGMDPGEDDAATLIREVQEETGYTVIPESIRPFGYIEEKRLSRNEPMIWHQINRIYFCSVDGVQGECDYSENEKLREMHLRCCTLSEALTINEGLLSREGFHPWNQREYRTLLLLREKAGLF